MFAQAQPKVFDDVIAQSLATLRPPPGASQLFDTRPQTSKTQDPRTPHELLSHLDPQPGEKRQLVTLA